MLRSRTALPDLLRMLPIRTYRHGALLAGMWKLRSNLSACDAAYVALARVLQATLVTRDSRLASAPDLGVFVEVP